VKEKRRWRDFAVCFPRLAFAPQKFR